ncbi:hypothetical protein Pmani_015780 [Petrolisthes manimaculis]|uniref:Uncharacterized protein n=1 Tax=Petrolisthes manimaculis TaxID=1843537 RepID=A0AAE1PQ92_9EUCA|nr:hypothetical protein Pmani_015780 [Petrolisthes manimaculis]
MADSKSVAFKTPGIRLHIRLPSRFEAVLPNLASHLKGLPDRTKLLKMSKLSPSSPDELGHGELSQLISVPITFYLHRNANNGEAAQVYRATAGTEDVLTRHLHACSVRSSIWTKVTALSLSLSPSCCDMRTFPHHHHYAQNAKEWQAMWGRTRLTI